MGQKPEFPDQPFTDVNKGATPNDPRPKHRSEFFTALNVSTNNTAHTNSGHKFKSKSSSSVKKYLLGINQLEPQMEAIRTSFQDGRLA